MLNLWSAIFFIIVSVSLIAEEPQKQNLGSILAEIEMAKAPKAQQEASPENKAKTRLNAKLEALKKLASHVSAKRTKPTEASFAALWSKMNSVEGRSVAYPELIMCILEMPADELIRKSVEVELVKEVPPATSGCCAIDSYYKFSHEIAKGMPDEIILAFRVRLRQTTDKPAKGLYHGIMIELVDRGYYESYNGYRCSDNKVSGCRKTAD